jgi:4-alpha-glucanotransferase
MAGPITDVQRAGVLCPVESLPGLDFQGTMGESAHEFVRLLRLAGQSFWTDLPFTPVDEHGSPYAGSSAFAGNPRRIDLKQLVDSGDLTRWEVDTYYQDPNPDSKAQLLACAYSQFAAGASTQRHAEFTAWRQAEAEWLHPYALYAALKSANYGKPWFEWPERQRNPDNVSQLADTQEYRVEQYIQWIFNNQALALKQEASKHGVQLIGDAPIYCGPDSADVWANQHLFELDHSGRPRLQAGVPDQIWGNPIYRWESCRDVYAWWVRRLRRVLDLTHVLRIDHVKAIADYWVIPAGETNPGNGWWQPGPGASWFQAMESALGSPLPAIAEDLGFPDGHLTHLLQQFRLPGMTVAQYGFGGENEHTPHRAVQQCVAYPGTHDNPSILEWLRRLDDGQRNHVRNEYCQIDKNIKEDEQNNQVPHALLKAIWYSKAGLVIAPIWDVLSLAITYNRPGTTHPGNWKWPLESLDGFAAQVPWLRGITEETGRL